MDFNDRPEPSHHRRRSSVGSQTLSEARSGGFLQIQPRIANRIPLSPVIGTPADPMSLSRSPSPVPGGGWSSPGLNINSGKSSPIHKGGNAVSWEPTNMRKYATNGHPSFSTQNQGFFTRHMRRISSSLPRFHSNSEISYAEREKLGREQWASQTSTFSGRFKTVLARIGRRLRWRIMLPLAFFCFIVAYYGTHEAPFFVHWWRRSPLGGNGEKFVIILAANVGGGVMEWKGAREWAIERDSVRNKRKYTQRWGYDLEIVDMKTRKRYAHEWRESWEKVDFLRTAMRKYPKAEWFWWLDLNTYVMEPSYSLQHHLFNHLDRHVYRDINEYNPLNISHPFQEDFLDPVARSAVGDGSIDSLNLLLSQDCSGFNLGSFFVRRGAWAERLLDIWWDPVAYEQKHMEWEHKEQDALEQLYRSYPWVRQHTGFLPQRMINSFPPAACGDESGQNNTMIHYSEKDRDFVVNMAGCEWGRDCWAEMYHYREFSYWLNRNPWELFKEEIVALIWYKITGQRVKL